MRRHYRNLWSQASASVLSVAHTRAPEVRWSLLILLAAAWFVFGFIGWYGGEIIEDGERVRITVLDAVYRTIGALSMSDIYIPRSEGALNVARFSGLAVPLLGILFAFWGQLGRSLAQGLHSLARNHIVICGADKAAVHLAKDCRAKGDSVVLIGADIPEDAAWAISKSGVFVIDGVGADRAALRAARAQYASHVVAFEEDDTLNLQIEAAMRALVSGRRIRPPIAVHVGTQSAVLLREAREMRSVEARRRGEKAPEQPIDPKPFGLNEIAARRLIQSEAVTLLDLAEQTGQERVHLVCFGFDELAQTVAACALKSLWSANFDQPRITVLSASPSDCESLFRAQHPEALAHPSLWAADIAFRSFDWTRAAIDGELLTVLQGERGQPTGVIISAGADPENIRLALALKRACNQTGLWPAPIYMKEESRSEFSAIYAKGDDTPELDAYLQAFGAHETTATRRDVIDAMLDRGAAIAHEHYSRGIAAKQAMTMKELQAAMKDWSSVLETYRSANRAVSDAALVKLWDAGLRPAARGEKGDTAPVLPKETIDRLAVREHDRWVAERLMSGWKPGAARNNDLMIHDKLVGWDALTEADHEKDREQVRAAVDIARLLYPRGFVPRKPPLAAP